MLIAEFGRGFSVANLTKNIELARLYDNSEIIESLSEQFTWFHSSHSLLSKTS